MSETKKNYNERFEFVFHVNGKIICQRSFGIRGYNKNAAYSLEIKELMDRITGTNNGKWGDMGIIPTIIKKRAISHLWDCYNEHNPYEAVHKNIYENEDFFEFDILDDGFLIASSGFSRNMFPQYVRGQVDIRDVAPDIIQDIRNTLSQDEYTHDYLTIEL